MKIAKKPLVLLLTLVMTLAIGLYGCKGEGDTPTPPVPSIEKIEITNTETNIGAGDLLITAKCSPEGIADTDYTVKINADAFGVSLEGKTLKVHPGALNGQTVSITVTSTADTNKTANKTFTVAVDDSKVTYEEITTGDELFAALGSGATAETMAKNYKLTGNIELSKVNGKGDSVLTRWSPSALPFTGLLDGNGYSINGLNMPYSGAVAGAGFFKINKGVIRNIGFDNSGDAAYSSHWMNLGANSGVVAGINDGGIANVYTNVITASTTGAVGAIVGTNNGFLVNSYALGVLNCNDTEGNKAGVVAINDGAIIGTVADKETTKLTSFVGNAAGQNDATLNAKLLSSKEMQTTATYSGMKWDESVWYFTNVYPMLKTADFNAEIDVEKSIDIMNNQIIEVGNYNGKPLQINVKATNAAQETINYAITNPEDVPGATISSTGAIMFDAVSTIAKTAGKFDGKTLTVKASLASNENISDTISLSLRDDGYNDAVGIVVATEQELYDTFFKTVDGNYFSALSPWAARAMSRTIKLGANIKMSAPTGSTSNKGTMWSGNKSANWRGAGGTPVEKGREGFTGIFDGQGYSISDFSIVIDKDNTFSAGEPYKDATGYDVNATWGFFRTLGSYDGKIPGVVKNLVIRGSASATINAKEGDRRYIGAIAQFATNGVIENCLIDFEVFSNSNHSGRVVGKVIGSESIGNAKREGSVRISNTLAIGKISSSLAEGESPARPGLDPYPVGGFVGYTEGVGSEFVNCYALGEDGSKNFTCRVDDNTDGGFAANVTKVVNSGIMNSTDFQVAATFADKGFDTNIWSFKDNCYPILKFPGFDAEKDQPAVPSVIEITNKNAAYFDYEAIKTGGIAIQTKTSNDKGMAPKFSIEPAVDGVSINDATGVITVTENVADNASVTAKVTLGEGGANVKGDSYSFKIYNDGYDPAVGIQVGTEAEFYNVFFKADDDTHGTSGANWLARAYTRKIVLTANIALTGDNANWPEIKTTFKGTLNGKGHTISGLAVDMKETADSRKDQGYGFFRTLQGASDQVVIENLVIKGSLKYQTYQWDQNNEANGVGVLVHNFNGGIIRNVLIDVNMQTNAEMNGKFAAYMDGSSMIENCIALGTIGNIDDATITYEQMYNGATAGRKPIRKNWANFAFGAIAGKLDGGNTILKNSFALGAEDKGVNLIKDANGGADVAQINDDGGKMAWRLGLANRNGFGGDGVNQGSAFKDDAAMKSAEAFEGFSTDIWVFAADTFPTLKVQA